jgi:hypothetical protein
MSLITATAVFQENNMVEKIVMQAAIIRNGLGKF